MLDYEWGNPTTMMLSSSAAAASDPPDLDSAVADSRHHIHTYDSYSFNNNVSDTNTLLSHSHHPSNLHHQFIPPPQFHNLNAVNSFFDGRAYGGASYSYPPPPPSSMLSLEPTNLPISGAGGFLMVPKTEDSSRSMDHHLGSGSRIGLNLGGRTYFSSSEDDFVNRLYRRSKPAMEAGSVNSPRCQAEGCAADLTHAKHYHRRHKVCEFHSKASTVIAAGLTQRFCQQCSRFHLLSEFDNGKRSCRKRLADHNRRRRKSHQTTNENQKSQLDNLSSDNLAGSPPDSGAHSSSSVTVAISPPRMSLDCFPPRQYGAAAFFSSG